jgi:predicted nucleic acid-binding protein
MKTVFVDSYYYLAFVNEDDGGHERAIAFSTKFHGKSVTTEWVLMEVADALSAPAQRSVFLELLEHLRADPGLMIIPSGPNIFERGVQLFAERPDKSWSLTDCISFNVMNDLQLTEALTADHHFAQAGFLPVLK